ncbi:uncharacterized protein M421DRAFT_4669 [Didymella exigua CBS 183.55]|uniref:Microbial-type PARG catalytic domain-containing protein n=1 Tax=Didymella exigua CBS 183.55 TaxID=1150837 RepID=A0A6A5RM23_9PLEO|nr:uncharacterized protein M421DRAFT_4669 [Didymella exigua CBS 183.55]KAF1928832.1 hypothetical protein M421DRAFT_4669 [Didymella exigua CBS 183.55]
MQQSPITAFFKKDPGSSGSRSEDQRPDSDRQGRRPGPYHSRGGSSTPSTRGQHRGGKSARNRELKKVAQETKDVLPAALKSLPGFGADVSAVYDLDALAPLDPADCPGYVLPAGDEDAGSTGTRIRVLDQDSLDAAIELQPAYKAQRHLSTLPAATSGPYDSEREASSSTEDDEMDLDGHPVAQPQPQPTAPSWDLSARPPQKAEPAKLSQKTTASKPTPKAKTYTIPPFSRLTPSPVLVLNLASERHPGGGWQTGAMAQEESLCYRSSLYRSLHRAFYPLPSLSVIYTPSVLIIRAATTAGHTLYPDKALDLPVASVLSVAALRHPTLTADGARFADPAQHAETKRKIRVSLRLAARMGHGRLVLGALGCGVFANPPTDVAQCFLQVFCEPEFQGGWWEDVVFAVMDNKSGGESGKDGRGNYGHFHRALHGRVV